METRTKLERLYWRIYETTHITNNELMAWLVRGWVVKHNGHQINWAKATASIIKKRLKV
jgi:hypothetical protein